MAGKTLADLLLEKFGVSTHPVINRETNTVGVAAVKVANNNPNRLGLSIYNLSANIVYLMIDNGVSATRGIILDANGGSLTLIWDEDFNLCAWEWFAIATGAGSAILVVEQVTE